MKVDDLITLVNAGFTKSDIFKIIAPQPESPAPAPQPESPTPAPQPEGEIEKLKQIIDDQNKTIAKLQASNINAAQHPQPVETAADVLASMLR